MPGNKPKLLLHVCCAPCATAVIERLLPDFDLALYFYNPNIQPIAEYLKRRTAVVKLGEIAGLKVFADDNDDEARWMSAVSGLENEPEGGKRCALCIALRIDKTAKFAAVQNYAFFATTLSISPHKSLEQIHSAGYLASEQNGVKYLAENFKKQDGYKRSIELTKQYLLYRQNYCGCLYAKKV